MMVNQFRRGIGGLGVGFALCEKGENIYGKVGECSGLNPSEKPSTTLKLIKITPPKPNEPIVKDGVFEESPKAPPQKQVWVPKPNYLKNPLDTLPNISEDPFLSQIATKSEPYPQESEPITTQERGKVSL